MRKQLAALSANTPPDAVRSGSVIWIGVQFDRRPHAKEHSASEQAAQCLRHIWQLLHSLGEPSSALVSIALSNIPLPTLTYPQMVIEIDCFAVTEPDCPLQSNDAGA